MPYITYDTPDARNIIVGAGDLYMDGEYMGYTTDGITIRKTNEWLDVIADQAGKKLKKIRTLESMMLLTQLLEATLDNLAAMLNEPASNLVAGSMYILGDSSLTTTEHSFKVVGPGPGTMIRTVNLFRGVIISDVEYPFKRDAVSQLPLEAELLGDSRYNDTFGNWFDAPPV